MAATGVVFLLVPEQLMGLFVDASELDQLRPFGGPCLRWSRWWPCSTCSTPS
jgi:hypothetical protein